MAVLPYIRWSSEKQGSGSTLARQTATIRAYAAEKGWHLPQEAEWLRDEGVSAFKGHNLAPAAALGRFTDRIVREGAHGTILLVEQLDRLSRRTPGEVLEWFFKVTNAGLTVALAENQMIVDQQSIRNQADQLRKLLDDAERANAEIERKSKLLRAAWSAIRDGMSVRVERAGTIIVIDNLTSEVNPIDVGINITVKTKRGTDLYELSVLAPDLEPSVGMALHEDTLLGEVYRKVHTSSTCPAWLSLSDCRRFFALIPERVAVVERIYCLFADGISKTTIARTLNADGIPTFRGGNGWLGSTVKYLVESRATIGEYQHMSRAEQRTIGDPVPNYFPAIITNELYQAANAPRSGHKREGRGRSIQVRNMLSDIARCQHCGSKMYFSRKPRKKSGRDDAYLQCSSYFLRKTDDAGKPICSERMMWHYRPILETLLDHILVLAMDDQQFSNDGEVNAIGAKIADQKRAIADIGTQLDNLITNMGSSTSPRLRARYEALEVEEDTAKKLLSDLERQLQVARGSVDPTVHVKRVSAIRADIDDAGDDGLRSRTMIRDALNGLIQSMLFDADLGFVNITLTASQRYFSIQSSGKMGVDFDLAGRTPNAIEAPSVEAYKRRAVAVR